MKKIKFLNGISAMFAFAIVFMTGSLLTSCEKENLNATFETAPAQVTLNVSVMDALTGNDITSKASVAVTGALKATGTTSFATGFPGGNVTITATYDGMTGSVTIATDAKKVGGVITYSANIILSSEYDFVPVPEESGVSEMITKPLSDQTHSHAGGNWCLNDHAYLLKRTFKYKAYNKQDATTDVAKLQDLATSMTYDKSEDKSVTYTFSAWCYYRVNYKGYITTTVYKVIRKGGADVFGKFTVVAKNNYSIEPEEKAYNSSYSHGHGHGTHNAGGGVVEAE